MNNIEYVKNIVSNITITPEMADLAHRLLESYLQGGKDDFTLYVRNVDRKNNDPLGIYRLVETAIDIAAGNEMRITLDISDVLKHNTRYQYVLKGDARTRIKEVGRLFDKIYHKVAKKIRENHPGIDIMIDTTVCSLYLEEALGYLQEVVDNINDTCRYTITIPQDIYIDGLSHFIAEMEKKGYTVYNVKNKWDNASSCRGIFLVFEKEYTGSGIDIELGNRFEVQVHTPQNYVFKEKSRVAYDVFRNPLADPDYRKLGDKMRRYYHGSPIAIPDGAVEWTYPIKKHKNR